jgi:hypothetical protein
MTTQITAALMNRSLLRELNTVGNDDWLLGISVLSSITFDVLDNIKTFDNLSEYNVFSVEPACFGRAEEDVIGK